MLQKQRGTAAQRRTPFLNQSRQGPFLPRRRNRPRPNLQGKLLARLYFYYWWAGKCYQVCPWPPLFLFYSRVFCSALRVGDERQLVVDDAPGRPWALTNPFKPGRVGFQLKSGVSHGMVAASAKGMQWVTRYACLSFVVVQLVVTSSSSSSRIKQLIWQIE